VRTLEERFPYRKTPQGIKRVLETGGVEHYALITQRTIMDADLTPEHVRALHELGIGSVIVVPLVGRERPLGAITLVAGDSGRHYDATDVQLARDLGQRAGMAVENARLYQSAQRAIAIRDEFLSIASHELKTPLTALRLQLHTILRGAQRPPEHAMPAERVSRAVDVAARQTERLAKLVDTLLDVSRITAGKLELEPETVDLGAAAREIVQRLTPELAAAGCTVELRLEPGVVGRWDRMRVDQIVTNLLTNAAKYGAGRPIEVDVGGDEHVARLRVRDHGIGIAENKLSRIFERFERGVSAREFGGLGLGLYIVRQIVEAHGGSVRAESLRDGARFEVDLPRSRDHRAKPAEAAA
jgi:signal transduction histidine kinase